MHRLATIICITAAFLSAMLAAHADEAEKLYLQGKALLDRGDLRGAARCLDDAIHKNPRYAPAWNARGAVYARQKQTVRALEFYTHAIRLDPRFFKPYRNRAMLYGNLHRYEEALRDADVLVSLQPDSLEALSLRCTFRAMAGRMDAALADCDEMARRWPGEAAPHQAKSTILAFKKQYPAALAEADRAVALEPTRAEWQAARANVLLCMNRFNAALAAAERAVALGRRPLPLTSRAMARIALKRYAEALSDLDQALAMAPDDVEFRFIRCVALSRVGRLDEALADIQKCIDQKVRLGVSYRFRSALYRRQGKTQLADDDAARAARAPHDPTATALPAWLTP